MSPSAATAASPTLPERIESIARFVLPPLALATWVQGDPIARAIPIGPIRDAAVAFHPFLTFVLALTSVVLWMVATTRSISGKIDRFDELQVTFFARLHDLLRRPLFIRMDDSGGTSYYAHGLEHKGPSLTTARALYGTSEYLGRIVAEALVTAVEAKVSLRSRDRSPYLEYDASHTMKFSLAQEVDSFGPCVSVLLVRPFLLAEGVTTERRHYSPRMPARLPDGDIPLNVVVDGADMPVDGRGLRQLLANVEVQAFVNTQRGEARPSKLEYQLGTPDSPLMVRFEPKPSNRLKLRPDDYEMQLTLKNVPHSARVGTFTWLTGGICAGNSVVEVLPTEPVRFQSWSMYPVIGAPISAAPGELGPRRFLDDSDWPKNLKVTIEGTAETPILPWEGITLELSLA